MQAAIANGCEVLIAFSLTLEDGSVVDCATKDAPLNFRVGDGTMAETLERPLLGLFAGTQATFLLGPEHAFGARDPINVHVIPRTEFSEFEPIAGHVISFETPGGDEIPGTVLAADETSVTIDFNHPLAGHMLQFAVDIIEVRTP